MRERMAGRRQRGEKDKERTRTGRAIASEREDERQELPQALEQDELARIRPEVLGSADDCGQNSDAAGQICQQWRVRRQRRAVLAGAQRGGQAIDQAAVGSGDTLGGSARGKNQQGVRGADVNLALNPQAERRRTDGGQILGQGPERGDAEDRWHDESHGGDERVEQLERGDGHGLWDGTVGHPSAEVDHGRSQQSQLLARGGIRLARGLELSEPGAVGAKASKNLGLTVVTSE